MRKDKLIALFICISLMCISLVSCSNIDIKTKQVEKTEETEKPSYKIDVEIQDQEYTIKDRIKLPVLHNMVDEGDSFYSEDGFDFGSLKDESFGTQGILLIPSVNIKVKLDFGHLDNYGYYGNNTQEICDKEDTAVFYQYGVQMVIADHENEEFSKLYGLESEDVAYIYNSDKTYYELSCTEVIRGINNGKDWGLYKSKDGPCLRDINKDGITMYTCYKGDSYNVFMTFWKYI